MSARAPSGHPSSGPAPTPRRGPRPAAVAAVSFALALLAVDLTFSWSLRDGRFGDRAIPPFGPLTSAAQGEWLAHQHTMLEREAQGLVEPEARTFDAELGWTRVNLEALESGGLHTRPPGSYGPTPPEGVLRIACFGDSFTYGAEVRDHECWPYYLERSWDGAEVPNFGVGGFGTDQALLRYRREGRALGARVVLMGMLVENIGRNVNVYRPLWYPASGTCVTKPRFELADGRLELVPNPYPTRAALVAAIEDGSVLAMARAHDYWAARPSLGPLRYSGLARMLAGYLAYRERDVNRIWSHPEREPFQVTLAILESFHREALADGAELAGVLIFPRQADLEDLAAGDRFWQAGLDRLDRAGVPWLDLADPLLEAWRAADDVDHLYQGGHLSPEANAIAARAIEDWLRARIE